jgi:predicted nucleic acid-binding protein
MPGAEFLDSNVVIYAYRNDLPKKARALDLLATTPTVSTQVFSVNPFRS